MPIPEPNRGNTVKEELLWQLHDKLPRIAVNDLATILEFVDKKLAPAAPVLPQPQPDIELQISLDTMDVENLRAVDGDKTRFIIEALRHYSGPSPEIEGRFRNDWNQPGYTIAVKVPADLEKYHGSFNAGCAARAALRQAFRRQR